MSEHDSAAFERRLHDRLQAYVAPEGLSFDAATVAAAAIDRADHERSIAHLRDRLVGAVAIGPVPARLVVALLLAALLATLTVVVVGQVRPSPPLLIPPEHGRFIPTGSMAADHHGEYTVTLLPDSRVLVVGGYFTPDTAEIWSPETGLWADAGRLVHPRASHSARLLADGRVLIVGGYYPAMGSEDAVPDPPPEVWEPSSMTFQDVDPSLALDPPGTAEPGSPETWEPDRYLVIARDGHASVWPSGRDWQPGVDPASVLGWDVAVARNGAAVVLADGRVLTLDGTDRDSGLMRSSHLARVWDPRTGVSTPTGSMAVGGGTTTVFLTSQFTYGYPNAVLLSDGSVLVVHGKTAELFELK
jgi:hypothetical protein